MGADLYERLKQLKRSGGAQAPGAGRDSGNATAPGAGHDPMGAEPPPGWDRLAPGVWRRRVYRHSEDAAFLHGLLRASGLPGSAGTPALVPPGLGAERLVFFDVETTGLSSGAGTTAFLAGFARIGPRGMTTEQLFMTDYPAEPEFLRSVAARIGEEDLAVSYNGKGFDAHVLDTRFLLNGARFPIGAQLDLLYIARRLWRRSLGQCTLGAVEHHVLGIRRGRDLPGAEVPGRYFEFLRSGAPACMDDVFAHHLQDIESLVSLLARIERVFADPAGARTDAAGVDRFQLGRMLLLRGRAGGEDMLRGVVREGIPVREALRAADLLAGHYRRAGRGEEVGEVWRQLLARHASVAAGIELAKHLEHRERDFRQAETLILELLSWPHCGSRRGDLEKRLARVRRRLARQSDADAHARQSAAGAHARQSAADAARAAR
ncbi:MAG: ribonuclease H-like domain-containing protein [Spirochaetaceae bacterium]